MIRVNVLYPGGEGKTFDLDYYLSTHIPLVESSCAPYIREVDVEAGVSGGAPGQDPTYVVLAHLTFDSVEDFQTAFGSAGAALMEDVPKFTNIVPVMQVSEVKV